MRIMPGVFYMSLALGLVIGVLLTLKGAQDLLPVAVAGSIGDRITYFLDVAILQSAAILLFASAYSFAMASDKSQSGIQRFLMGESRRFIEGFVVMAGVLIAATLLEMLIFKPSFSYLRPLGQLSDSFFARLFPFGGGMRSSTPSGFVMRQTIITLGFIAVTQQRGWKENVKYIQRTIYNLIVYTLMCGIVFLRIYRGQHTLYDSGMAISIGTLTFWIAMVAVVLFSNPKEGRRYAGELAVPAITYSATIFLFTQDTIYWLGFSGIVVVLLMIIGIHTAEEQI